MQLCLTVIGRLSSILADPRCRFLFSSFHSFPNPNHSTSQENRAKKTLLLDRPWLLPNTMATLGGPHAPDDVVEKVLRRAEVAKVSACNLTGSRWPLRQPQRSVANAESLRWPGSCRNVLHWQATKLSTASTTSVSAWLRPTSTKRSSKNDQGPALNPHQILHRPRRDIMSSPAHLVPLHIVLHSSLTGSMVQGGVRGIESDTSINLPFRNLLSILALARGLGPIRKLYPSLNHLEHLGRQITTYPNHPLSTVTNMDITKVLTSLPFPLSRKYLQSLIHLLLAVSRMETVLAFPSTVSICTQHSNPHLLVPRRLQDLELCATGKPMSVKKAQQTYLCTSLLLRPPLTPLPNPETLIRQRHRPTLTITTHCHHP